LFLKKMLHLHSAHELKPLSRVQGPTAMSSTAFCTFFKYQLHPQNQNANATPPHPMLNICFQVHLETRLFLVFLNPCFTPLPAFQPSLPDKTSEYTSIALVAVLEVPTVSFYNPKYNPNPFTFENYQKLPSHQPTGPTFLCQCSSHTRHHHALPRSPRPGKSS
jgi:hypothetical protein